MIRTFNFRRKDLTSDTKVTHINIESVSGFSLYYKNKDIEEGVIDLEEIKDLYIQTENEDSHTGTIIYYLSYDGSNWSNQCVLKVTFKELNTDKVYKLSPVDIWNYFTPNLEFDYTRILGLLHKNGLADVTNPIVVLPILSFYANIPDKYKKQFSYTYITSIPSNILVVLEIENTLIPYIEGDPINTKEISNVFAIIPEYKTYNKHITLTIKDSNSNRFPLILGDIKKEDDDFYCISLEKYKELIEDE